ncbi:MAG: hypothetical protein N2512_00455, partial [Armatimonadetes bacterium]|nr:hypothetical protein [Armatimonadota bacterium]
HALAATEQEVAQRLVADLRDAVKSAQEEWAVHAARHRVAMQLADDERALHVRLAGKQLAADLAEAAANLSGVAENAAQARSQYIWQAVGQAISRFQQSISQANQMWSQAGSAAWSRLQQDASGPWQAMQQAFQAAHQRAIQAIQAIDPNAPAVITKDVPLVAESWTEPETLAALENTLGDVRMKYLQDIEAAFARCDQELSAAVKLAQPADVGQALRKAVTRLRVETLDRYDQYKTEVTAALRKALLATME